MIQYISHYTERYSYLDGIELALRGGCRWIQLRMKEASDEEIVRTGLEARRLCDAYGATLILDDHVDLVQKIGANGVHLGKKDMPISEARKMLGPDLIIGGTANTFDDVLAHYQASANYIGCGPFRFTTTKHGLSPILGLEGYRSILAQMREAHIDIPLVAIGGITADDIPALRNAGIHGIALSGAILRADDPVTEMRQLLSQMSQ